MTGRVLYSGWKIGDRGKIGDTCPSVCASSLPCKHGDAMMFPARCLFGIGLNRGLR